MAREIPEVVRAVAGLAATVLDETRRLPETLPSLPIRLLGLAMQASMKLQQQYAGLVARGDELLTGTRGEDEPGLATFDDEEEQPLGPASVNDSAFDRVAETILEVTEDEEGGGAAADEALADLAIEELVDEAPAPAPEGAEALDEQLLSSDRDRDADGLPEEVTLAASPTADVDVLAPDGMIETVEATVTDEGVAAVEGGAATGPAGAPTTPAAPTAATVVTPTVVTPTVVTPTVVTPGDAAVDEALGGAAGEDRAERRPAPDATTTAVDESGTPVAEATGEPAADATAVPTGEATTGAATAGAATAGAATAGEATAGEAAPDGGTADGAPAGDTPAGDTIEVSLEAPRTAPVDGYDDFSIAQLRGHLRGYARTTVQGLLDYEQDTRARDPYLRMLRNRLERLEADGH